MSKSRRKLLGETTRRGGAPRPGNSTSANLASCSPRAGLTQTELARSASSSTRCARSNRVGRSIPACGRSPGLPTGSASPSTHWSVSVRREPPPVGDTLLPPQLSIVARLENGGACRREHHLQAFQALEEHVVGEAPAAVACGSRRQYWSQRLRQCGQKGVDLVFTIQIGLGGQGGRTPVRVRRPGGARHRRTPLRQHTMPVGTDRPGMVRLCGASRRSPCPALATTVMPAPPSSALAPRPGAEVPLYGGEVGILRVGLAQTGRCRRSTCRRRRRPGQWSSCGGSRRQRCGGPPRPG